MHRLEVLSGKGSMDVLRRLGLGEASFRELSETVPNSRTLTRRLKELAEEKLIQKAGSCYRITSEGFNTVIKAVDVEGKARSKWVNEDEFSKVRYGWMRTSLGLLTEFFHKEFGNELISILLYGSALRDSFQLGRSDIDLLYVLEDGSKDVWKREASVFKSFQSTWEFRAPDYWLKTQGFHGYPEVAMVWLRESDAKTFQPVYLDMLRHRAILYDREAFFRTLMRKLEEALKALGTVRKENLDGTYLWLLKPNMTPGELIEIDLG